MQGSYLSTVRTLILTIFSLACLLPQLVYGADKFYLPLRIPPHETHLNNDRPGEVTRPTVNTDSALAANAIPIIRSGACNLCATPDKFHRPVFLHDREKNTSPSAADVDLRNQAYFYFMHVLSENDAAVANGVVGILALEGATSSATTARKDDTTRKVQKVKPSRRVFDVLASEAVPIPCKAFHVVAPGSKPSLVQLSINSLMGTLEYFTFLRMRTRLHYVEDPTKAVDDLETYGMDKNHLPQQFGGTHDFARWWEERMALEADRYSFLNASDDDDDEEPPSSLSTDEVSMAMATAAQPSQQMSEEEAQRQQDQIKQKLEEIHEYNKIQIKRWSMKRLQKEQIKLRQEEEQLKRRIACAEYALQNFNAENQKIVQFIHRYVASPHDIPGGLSPEVANNLPSPADSQILRDAYEYLGRNFLTNQLMFRKRG